MDIVINAEIESVPEGSLAIASRGNYYHHLLACLDYPDPYPPVADLLRRFHGLEGQCLIASPIHWQATHNDAMIVASGNDLQLSEPESRLWFAALAEFLAADNMQLYFHDATTWLLQCEGKPALIAKPVHSLLHQSMMPQLRNLDESLFWQRLITETQMFLSAHPLNQSGKGKQPINGIWIWGSGSLLEKKQKPCIASDKDSHALARLLSKEVHESHLTAPLTKDTVLLFSDLAPQDRLALQTRLEKYKLRWYWNNIAYETPAKRWFSRLIGRKT